MQARVESKGALQRAVSAVKQNRMKLREAAREFGVPKSTLSGHLHRSLKPKPGPMGILTDEEEVAFVNYLSFMADTGFPLTRNRARIFVQEIVRKGGRAFPFKTNINNGPSDEWLRKLFKRQPELSERTAENLDKARAAMSTVKVVDDFFDFLDTLLTRHDLKDKPSQIFNCDEAGWSGKEASRAKVITKGKGRVFQQKVLSDTHVTANLCICADGRVLPTMVIYKGSLPHTNFTEGVPDSWLYGTSESGYIDGELFYKWFMRIFLPNCGRVRPVALIMDNHDAHITLPVLDAAIENDIILIGFPGHTTHLFQPLDIKVIGPLKARFTRLAGDLGFISPTLTIGKSKYPILIRYAIDQTSPASIQNAFAAAGICPFNKDAIDRSQLAPPTFLESGSHSDDTEQIVIGRSCKECGCFIVNPLVSRGLVPESLASVLVPQPRDPTAAKKRRQGKVVKEGRVISGNEVYYALKEKEEAEKARLAASERRQIEKEEREKRKVEEETEKTAKKQRREREK